MLLAGFYLQVLQAESASSNIKQKIQLLVFVRDGVAKHSVLREASRQRSAKEDAVKKHRAPLCERLWLVVALRLGGAVTVELPCPTGSACS